MCIRPYSDYVSNEIRMKGEWSECRELLKVWKASNHGKSSLFVDIGANIGSCSLLLASEGAKVLSFEPIPSNLFYFTSSIMRNNQFDIQLYPFGLGNVPINNVLMFSEPHNRGNSVVSKPLPVDSKGMSIMETHNVTIQISTLDDILFPQLNVSIDLIKLDVQGYEVNVLKGGKSILSSGFVKYIYFEMAPKF